MEPIAASSGQTPVVRPIVAISGDLSVSLNEGRVLSGEVVQTLGGDSVLLAIGSDKVAADTQVELRPGQRYFFRAEREAGRTVLRVLPEVRPDSANALLDALRVLVGSERPLGSVLAGVGEALRAEAPDVSPARIADVAEGVRSELARIGTEAGIAAAGTIEKGAVEAALRTLVESLGGGAGAVLEALRAAAAADAPLVKVLDVAAGDETLQRRIEALVRPLIDVGRSDVGALMARLDETAFRPGASGAALRTLLKPAPLGYEAVLLAAAHESGGDDRSRAIRALAEVIAVRLEALHASPPAAQEIVRIVEQGLVDAKPLRVHGEGIEQGLARHVRAFQAAVIERATSTGAPIAEALARLEPGALLAGREGALLRVLLARGGAPEDVRSADVLARQALDASPRDLRGALTAGALELDPGPARETVGRAVAALDLDALLNLARREFGEATHVSFAVPDGAGWTTADLFHAPHAGGGDDAETEESEAPFRLTLAVDFSQLGPIRADLLISSERLAARLVVRDPQVAQGLRGLAGELESLLAVEGRAVHLSISESNRSSEPVAPHPHDIGLLRDTHLMDLSG
ncbi:MAG: hypothetical protein GY711_12735 [bacterium]|nr:hypothetical protein [bacterium]